ncbi:hypothetical protein DBY68_012620 [Pseudocitrobacter sp. RIT415]|nr:hypothetical protein DBY68_012620 [Pseudocitrobacter sp. RIT 415]
MSLLDEKRGLLYWKFSLAISPARFIRTFAERLLRRLTKINKIEPADNRSGVVRYCSVCLFR